jgi:dTDP-4-amino-4,6-dideoxygalactose transaminase
MSNAINYNPWPIGRIPKHLQRTELEQVRNYFDYRDPRELVEIFEKQVALFAGSFYGVSTDCCTHAIELCLRLKMELGELKEGDIVTIPQNTYISLPMTLQKLNLKFRFEDIKWEGVYALGCEGVPVLDSAVRWKKDMYSYGTLQCLSFQIKKRIPIGRGGMILTDNPDYAEYLKLSSYDGRDLRTSYDSEEHVRLIGYHYYMTPEDAARGLILMQHIKEEGDSGSYLNYPNLNKWLKPH